mmetsp:Transcript_15490/g.36991  ORF Transcript_15490/g.36991 Transcript_15490/m.36991 type:complete len:265 (+) Transcript_15490:1-795(+)
MAARALSRADRIRKLLKTGIETGDPTAVDVINPDKYIQHNPQTTTGREGLKALFAKISKTNPRVNIVRAFEDGDYVFGHTEYDFSTRRIGFEVFRFEGEFTVEHWDNIQPRQGPNAAGHSMVDGPTEAGDPGLTEGSRALAREFIESVRIGGNTQRLDEFVSADAYTEHHPHATADGIGALRDSIEGAAAGTIDPESGPVIYEKVHRVLACGCFALTVTEGTRGGKTSAFYDLFRVEGKRIVEHWDTIEAVAPPEEWKNDNGKF